MRGNYKQITICKGQENHAREENIYDPENFFSDVYTQAKACLQEVLKFSHAREKEMSSCDPHKCQAEDFSLCSDANLNSQLVKNHPTNIIAFCAERGGGKTTAMVSFAAALSNIDPQMLTPEQMQFWKDTSVGNHAYEVVNRIDPTAMEEHDTILRMILSRMFSQFQLACDRRYHRNRVECCTMDFERERNELAGLFQHCYHNLGVLTAKPDKSYGIEDELEQIADLGDSANLRGALYRLVRKYLQFLCPSQNAYLIIQIDDTDLNVDKAYTILEDIRKYLQLPRIIILLAANMKQMECTVEQYFIKKYEPSLRQPGSMIDVVQCHLISEQYLEKLIPSFMRIFLPDLNRAIQENAQQLRVNYELSDPNTGPRNLLEDDYAKKFTAKWRYQQQLLYFLHRKTGLIFWAPKNYLHNFLPSTLRELAHFLSYFGDMQDVSIGYHDLIGYFTQKNLARQLQQEFQTWKDNLEKLECYLLHSWSAVNLRKNGAYYLREFASQPRQNMHRYILKLLPSYYAHERMQMDNARGVSLSTAKEYQQAFVDECEKKGVYIDETLSSEWMKEGKHIYLSYADVVTALEILTELPGGNQQYKFCYAIRLYYSIYLHQMMLYTIQQEKPTFNPADFFDDVLFRQGGQGERGSHFAFWHIPVKPERVYQVFMKDRQTEGQDGGANKGVIVTEYSFLRAHLRVEEKERSHYRMCPLDQERLNALKVGVDNFQKEHAGEVWIFNPFYYLLHEWYILFHKKDVDSSFYQTNQEACVRMHHAMVILLNWDIQNHLLHEYKKPVLKKDGNVYQQMQSLFEQSFMSRCLQEVGELNDLNIVEPRIPLLHVDQQDKNSLYIKLQLCFDDDELVSVPLADFQRKLCKAMEEVQNLIKNFHYPLDYDLVSILNYPGLETKGTEILNTIDYQLYKTLESCKEAELLLENAQVDCTELKHVLDPDACHKIPIKVLLNILNGVEQQLEPIVTPFVAEQTKGTTQQKQEETLEVHQEENGCMQRCIKNFEEKMCDHITEQLSQELVKQWMDSKETTCNQMENEMVQKLARCMSQAFSVFQAAMNLSGITPIQTEESNSKPKRQRRNTKKQNNVSKVQEDTLQNK